MDKKQVLEAIIAQKEAQVNDWQNVAQTQDTSKDLDETETIDIDELSQQDQATELSNFSQNRMDEAASALAILKSYAGQQYDAVGKGALVDAGSRYYFIGPSLPNMEVDGKQVVFVSENSPAYEAMQGLKKGGTFKLGDEEVTINDIQ